jgi:uncharacterized membrane protein
MPSIPESSHLREQIDLIARHEREFLDRRTHAERVGDAIGSLIGSLWFIGFHVLWITTWIVWNTFRSGPHFDPAPFPLLDIVVALEAIFLASFIVMRQSRLSRRADERAHLILQILILTEREMTAVLGIERQIAARIGLPDLAIDETLERMSQETQIDQITQEIQENLPDNS